MKRKLLSFVCSFFMVVGIATTTTSAITNVNLTPDTIMEATSENLFGMQNMNAQMMILVRGQFTDFFPDPQFAQLIANEFGRNKIDQVTLFELQQIQFIQLCGTGQVFSTEGIGWLMGLKTIFLEVAYFDEIIITEDISNCFILERIHIFSTEAIVHFPDALVETSLSEIFVYDSPYTETIKTGYNLSFGDILSDKVISGDINLKYSGGITESITIEAGTKISASALLPDIMKYNYFVYGAGADLTFANSDDYLGVSVSGHASDSGDLDLFFNDFENQISELAPGEYVLSFWIDGAGTYTYSPHWSVCRLDVPITITQGPLQASFSMNTPVPSFDGKYLVAMSGSISGWFNEGLNTLDATAISSFSNLSISFTDTQTGSIINTGTENILGMTVTVQNGAVTQITVVGMQGTSIYSCVVLI